MNKKRYFTFVIMNIVVHSNVNNLVFVKYIMNKKRDNAKDKMLVYNTHIFDQ
jgi:hypothetical protein